MRAPLLVRARPRGSIWLCSLLIWSMLGTAARAERLVWNGSEGDGDWFNAANWNPPQIPADGDDAVIDQAMAPGVLLTNSTAALSVLAITNATLTTTNWVTTIRAAETIVANQATVTCAGPFIPPGMSNRVQIVCSNLTVASGGRIDVDRKGYSGGTYRENGYGPGASTYSHTAPSAGAGHGGDGGLTSGLRRGGPRYGAVETPETPGSGSGATYNARGVHGGGVIRIAADGHVRIDGILSANGESGILPGSRPSGGGAGGSVWISCRTFAGMNGVVQADGGAGLSDNSGGGGGGYIALHYDTEAQSALEQPLPSVRFTVNPGRGESYHPVAEPPAVPMPDDSMYVDRTLEADWGALYFSDDRGVVSLSETVDNIAGYLAFGNAVSDFSLVSLVLDNAYLGFADDASLTVTNDLATTASGGLIGRDRLTLTVGGDTFLRGDSRIDGVLHFSGAGDLVVEDAGAVSLGSGSTVLVNGALVVTGEFVHVSMKGVDAAFGGDIFIQDGAWMACRGDGTNGSLGEFAMRLATAGDLRLDSGAHLYCFADPDRGGIPEILCRDLVVSTGAEILGDGRGYGGTRGPGSVSGSGTAPNGGGGHGGGGGVASNGRAGGVPYGSTEEPREPGSGGGATHQDANGETGGAGLRIAAKRHVLVNGLVSANGSPGRLLSSDRNTGGGAGGSIWLSCVTFAGTGGVVRAEGGDGAVNVQASGGGGGGRIAVHYDTTAQSAMPPSTVRFSVGPGRGFRPLEEPTTQYLADKTAYIHRQHEADWGSLYFSDPAGIVPMAETMAEVSGYLNFACGSSTQTLASLTLDNACVGFGTLDRLAVASSVSIPANSALLGRTPISFEIGETLEIAGEMRLDAPVEIRCGGELRIDSSGTASVVEQSILEIGGDLVVTGAAANLMMRGIDLQVAGGVLLADGAWLSAMGHGEEDGGSLMTMAVAGDLQIASNACLYVYSDPDQGASPRFRCNRLTVLEGGAFRADARGYVERMGPGQGAYGGAPSGSPTGAGGAGHGAPGGQSANLIAGGIAYGQPLLPVAPGSGGGYCANSARGGTGGGLIRVRVQKTAQIDGRLDANGGDGGLRSENRAPGGGSGGGIHLVAGGLLRGGPTGRLTATGGHSGDPTHVAGGGGAGGRIAVWEFIDDAGYDLILAGDFSTAVSNRVPVHFSGEWTAAGGQGFEDGGDGTIVFLRAQPSGTLLLLR